MKDQSDHPTPQGSPQGEPQGVNPTPEEMMRQVGDDARWSMEKERGFLGGLDPENQVDQVGFAPTYIALAMYRCTEMIVRAIRCHGVMGR